MIVSDYAFAGYVYIFSAEITHSRISEIVIFESWVIVKYKLKVNNWYLFGGKLMFPITIIRTTPLHFQSQTILTVKWLKLNKT